jgi:hypothetical protein
MPVKSCYWLIMSALLLAGCNFFTPPGAQETLAADYGVMATQITNLRQTATYETERLLVTQEAIQTAMRDVEVQSTRISATLVALGTPFVDVSAITPAAADAVAGLLPTPTLLVVLPGGAASGSLNATAPTIAPTAIPNAAPTDPNAPALTNISTTEQVGGDNCALSPTNAFSSTTSGVYIVATAFNLTPQNVITYRWERDSIEIYVDTWSPQGDTDGQCIWYYVTPAEVTFEAGAWAIEILIDNVPVGSPIAFTVSP